MYVEKWNRWSYLQSRNGDIDGKNKFMDNKGGGTNLKIGIDMCRLLVLCIK